METADPKRRNRIVGWATNKFNGTTLSQVHQILAENARRTRERARVAEVSREELEAGIQGRYPDGGRARFEKLRAREAWTDQDLAARARRWRMQALIYLFGAILTLTGAMMWILMTPGWFAVLMFVPGIVVPLGLLAVALKADFAARQIRSRRFGGLREYFKSASGS